MSKLGFNRRRWTALALLLGCFAMICVAAMLLRGIKPKEHARGLLLMVWMLACITGMIIGMVMMLAGRAPRRSLRDEAAAAEREARERLEAEEES